MRLLIDSHAFLWFVSDANELSQRARSLMEDRDNQILISIASLWEISIKTALGRLNIDGDYASVIDDLNTNSIEILPLEFSHTLKQTELPFYHGDPFDRIIISQALVENINIISADKVFDQYITGRIIRYW